MISSRCPELCNGHGKCLPQGGCQCDDGYLGDACELIGVGNPQEFHETFNSSYFIRRFYCAIFIFFQGKLSDQPEWTRIVGGERVAFSTVGLGEAFTMNQPGVRVLETRDLDLTHAKYTYNVLLCQFEILIRINFSFVQFYLDSTESIATNSVLLLQHSPNGGIHWTTFYVIHLSRAPFQEVYQIPIPPRATTAATRLRWSQVGEQPDASAGGWIIDEVRRVTLRKRQ